MLNRVLGALGRILIFSGVVLLLWVAFTLWGTNLYEAGEQSALAGEFAAELSDRSNKTVTDSPDAITKELASIDPATVEAIPPPPEGDALGFIAIPKIGLDARVVVEGVTKADLRKGPGHYPGTPMPGQRGNAAIAGHRTTYGAPFHRIDELVPGDRIETYTRQGKFVYEVIPPPGGKGIETGAGWYSVRPSDGSVIGPTDDDRLTLTACHPKYSAAQRIIVHAKLVSEPAPSEPIDEPSPGQVEDGDREPASTVASSDEALIAGDPAEKVPAMLWGGAFLALWCAMWFLAARLTRQATRRWPVFVIGTPLSAVFLWLCFGHLDRFLPSF